VPSGVEDWGGGVGACVTLLGAGLSEVVGGAGGSLLATGGSRAEPTPAPSVRSMTSFSAATTVTDLTATPEMSCPVVTEPGVVAGSAADREVDPETLGPRITLGTERGAVWLPGFSAVATITPFARSAAPTKTMAVRLRRLILDEIMGLLCRAVPTAAPTPHKVAAQHDLSMTGR
jgi:hypothetical protein